MYQDLGNSIFSFISADTTEAKERNNRCACAVGARSSTVARRILIRALSTLGITAEASGRNDITVDGRKVPRIRPSVAL